ncbi:MAG TPA: phage holin family protein, partial [Candidatus Limnocylindria bacterium]|nr:phage holin family protein [Candidatus Limnocylindria bacterium]
MARILQILVNAAALWVAVQITEMDWTGAEAWQFLLVAVIFSLVNTFIRPILRIITLPITAVTLGLFLVVINALMLLLTGWISDQLELGFMVNGFVPALLGAIVISI